MNWFDCRPWYTHQLTSYQIMLDPSSQTDTLPPENKTASPTGVFGYLGCYFVSIAHACVLFSIRPIPKHKQSRTQASESWYAVAEKIE